MNSSEVETLDLLSSQIHYGNGALQKLVGLLDEYSGEGKKLFLLTDSNTHESCLPHIRHLLPKEYFEYVVPPGENNKSLQNAEKIWKWMLGMDAGRDDLWINLGGGMVTDLGGFVASVFKRGMDYINIPTSLIGQADAAIGGKTSVNLSLAKNQVGSFHFPVAVIIDPVLLKTLPEKQLRSGYAEILKGALLTGEKSWGFARRLKWSDTENLLPSVKDAVKMKARMVMRDPKDKGARKALNFGHTLGHAFESLSLNNYPPGLLHGDAVASGMIGETYISWYLGKICWTEMSEINAFLRRTFPPIPFFHEDAKDLLDIILKDKKNRAGKIMISTLKKIGEPAWDVECDLETIGKAIEYVLKERQP